MASTPTALVLGLGHTAAASQAATCNMRVVLRRSHARLRSGATVRNGRAPLRAVIWRRMSDEAVRSTPGLAHIPSRSRQHLCRDSPSIPATSPFHSRCIARPVCSRLTTGRSVAGVRTPPFVRRRNGRLVLVAVTSPRMWGTPGIRTPGMPRAPGIRRTPGVQRAPVIAPGLRSSGGALRAGRSWRTA